jgi:hypothetical protein
MLLLGRVCGGIATSLLYSTFETWAVTEHQKLGLPDHLLGKLFGDATTMNAAMAIVGGLLAHILVEYSGHPVAAFNGACVPLVICACCVWSTWEENFGDAGVEVQESFGAALQLMRRDTLLCAVGGLSAMFEGVMYVFIFMWTPALESRVAGMSNMEVSVVNGYHAHMGGGWGGGGGEGGMGVDEMHIAAPAPGLEHGLVFALFMVWKMAGASLCSLLSSHPRLRLSVPTILLLVFGVTTWFVLPPPFPLPPSSSSCCCCFFPCSYLLLHPLSNCQLYALACI